MAWLCSPASPCPKPASSESGLSVWLLGCGGGTRPHSRLLPRWELQRARLSVRCCRYTSSSCFSRSQLSRELDMGSIPDPGISRLRVTLAPITRYPWSGTENPCSPWGSWRLGCTEWWGCADMEGWVKWLCPGSMLLSGLPESPGSPCSCPSWRSGYRWRRLQLTKPTERGGSRARAGEHPGIERARWGWEATPSPRRWVEPSSSSLGPD